MKLKNILSEAMSGLPMMKVISNPFAKSFAVVNEAEDDKYVHIGYGKYKEKGKEGDKSAPTFTKDDSGKYVPSSGGDSKPQGDQGGETKPNMFAKGYDAPDLKKDEPKSEPSQPKREGDPQVNKATLSKAKKLGITPQKLGKEEYQKKMAQAAVAALTDANFHSEARELIAKLEGKPEEADIYQSTLKMKPGTTIKINGKIRTKDKYGNWRHEDDENDILVNRDIEKILNSKDVNATVYSSDYYNADDDTEDLGVSAAQEAGWDGIKAADSIAYTLRQNGFDKLADTIQSVIKENKTSKLKLTKLIK
jgi:hypothetical protein